MARTAKVTTEEIAGQTGRFLLVVRSNRPTVKLLEMLPHPERTIVVWSMWRGYWDRDRWLSAFCERQGTEPVFVHSGGHARVEDLQRLAKAVRPRMVVPIHTGAAQAYAELFERVRPVENGVPVEF